MQKKMKLEIGALQLAATAKRVRAQFSDPEIYELLKLPSKKQKAALRDLDDKARPVADIHIVGAIMAMQRGRASEGEFERAFAHIRLFESAYSLSWLRGARDLCIALIDAEEFAQKANFGPSNVIGVAGHKELVHYVHEGLRQLNARNPKLFRHGTEVARIVSVVEEDFATVQTLNQDQFSAALPMQFEKQVGDKKTISAAPPIAVVKEVFHTPDLPLPYLAGLTRFPTFGRDGSVQMEPGYAASTQTFYAPPAGLTIPQIGRWSNNADRVRDLAAAKRLLIEEVIADFPFDGWSRKRIMAAFDGVSGERLPASLMNALAMAITPFVRAMISGPVPLTLVTKPQAGTGATYLTEVIQIIVSGTASARPPLAQSEEERRKVLFTCVGTGEPLALFDNQKGQLDSPSLASVLTSTSFTDRVLGRSEERRVPVRTAFAMTSNNLGLSEELQRRVSLVRLHAQTADPKSRSGWRHVSLHAYAEINRGQLLWAILTLIASWVHQGCQGPEHCPAVPSYGGWCFVIGGILEAADANWTAFQHNREVINQLASAGEEDGFAQLMTTWSVMGGERTAAELAAIIESDGIEIEGLKLSRDGVPSTVSVGKQLASYVGRRFVVGGQEFELVVAGERKRAKVWALTLRGAAPAKAAAELGPVVPRTYNNYPLRPAYDKSEACREGEVSLSSQRRKRTEVTSRRRKRAIAPERRQARSLA